VVEDERKAEAVDAAARLLRHGDRSRAELETRLTARGIDPDALTDALDTLERVGAFSDSKTAELRATALAERGYGDAWIRAELERRSLPVDEALAGLEPERERAGRILGERGGGAATARYLARRGFDEDTVEAAFANHGREGVG
jgi:SOS response regulatory protein OraA/RecX